MARGSVAPGDARCSPSPPRTPALGLGQPTDSGADISPGYRSHHRSRDPRPGQLVPSKAWGLRFGAADRGGKVGQGRFVVSEGRPGGVAGQTPAFPGDRRPDRGRLLPGWPPPAPGILGKAAGKRPTCRSQPSSGTKTYDFELQVTADPPDVLRAPSSARCCSRRLAGGLAQLRTKIVVEGQAPRRGTGCPGSFQTKSILI